MLGIDEIVLDSHSTSCWCCRCFWVLRNAARCACTFPQPPISHSFHCVLLTSLSHPHFRFFSFYNLNLHSDTPTHPSYPYYRCSDSESVFPSSSYSHLHPARFFIYPPLAFSFIIENSWASYKVLFFPIKILTLFTRSWSPILFSA